MRVAVFLLAVVSITAAGLFWDRGRIATKLVATEARLQSAVNDAATKAKTLEALRSHAARQSILDRQREVAESRLRNSEGFDDEVPGIILDAISDLGLR